MRRMRNFLFTSPVTTDNFPTECLSHLNSYFVNSFLYLPLPSFPCPGQLKSSYSEVQKAFLPPFAGDDAHLLTVSLQRDSSGLPPLIIRGIDNMENISVFKAKSLTWQPTVLALVIVKHGSERNGREGMVRNLRSYGFKIHALEFSLLP